MLAILFLYSKVEKSSKAEKALHIKLFATLKRIPLIQVRQSVVPTAVIGDCCRITQNDRQPCLGLLVNTKSCNGTVQRAIEKDSLILETFLVRCRTVSLLLQQLSKPRAFALQLSRGKAHQAYERGTRTLPKSCRTDFNKSS